MYLTEGMTFTQRVEWDEEIPDPAFEAPEGEPEAEAPTVRVHREEERTYEIIAASGEVATDPGVEVVRVKAVRRLPVQLPGSINQVQKWGDESKAVE